MRIPFFSRSPRRVSTGGWIPAAAGFAAILAVAAIVVASPSRQPMPEQSLDRLGAAVKARDADTALSYIDVDALARNILLRVYKQRNVADAEAKAAQSSSAVADQYRRMFTAAIKEGIADKKPDGSIIGSLAGISELPVVRVDGGSAYVELAGGERYLLRKAGDRWVISDFVGFEGRVENFAERARDILSGRGQGTNGPAAGEQP